MNPSTSPSLKFRRSRGLRLTGNEQFKTLWRHMVPLTPIGGAAANPYLIKNAKLRMQNQG